MAGRYVEGGRGPGDKAIDNAMGSHYKAPPLFLTINSLVGVDAQDGLSRHQPREREQQLAVEAARAAQRPVEGVGAVGRADDDHLGEGGGGGY